MPNPSHSSLPMPLPGSLIGPWRLLEYVGEGAYGLVYRCVRYAEPHAGPYALNRPEPLRAPSELATVGPQLEKLILRMLSAEPAARGTAGELAEALEQVAARLGARGDLLIQPVSSAAASRPRRLKPMPRRLKFALAAASLVWALWALSKSTHSPPVQSQEAAWRAGLGMPAPAAAPQPAAPAQQTLAQDTPPKPLPEQTQPAATGSCPHKLQEVLKGACWWPLAVERAECEAAGGQMFKGRCYVPVMPTRPPSSLNPATTP